jgi:hypothetical protein
MSEILEMCPKHTGKKPKYVCINCDDALICGICEKTAHNGHTLQDIEDTANEKRQRLQEKGQNVKKYSNQMRSLLDEKRQFQHVSEESFAKTKDEIQSNNQYWHILLSECLEHVEIFTEDLINTDCAMLSEEVLYPEKLLKDLQDEEQKLTELLKDGVTNRRVIQCCAHLETSADHVCCKTHSYIDKRTKSNLLIFLPKQQRDRSEQKKIIQGLFCYPKRLQTNCQIQSACQTSEVSTMALVEVFTLRMESPKAPMLALHIAAEDLIIVAHPPEVRLPQNAAESSGIIVEVFDNNGQSLHQTVVQGVTQPIIITTQPDKRVFLFCGQNSKIKEHIFDLGTLFSDKKLNAYPQHVLEHVGIKKQTKSKSYKVVRLNAEGSGLGQHVFTVLLRAEKTPERVIADKEESRFAIIISQSPAAKKGKAQTEQVEPETSKVLRLYAVNKDEGPSKPPNCLGYYPNKTINDAHFYYNLHDFPQGVLIVATDDALVLLDPYNHGCNKMVTFFLGNSLADKHPQKPTLLATDYCGDLWIGCQGGRVLCWKPESVAELVPTHLFSLIFHPVFPKPVHCQYYDVL